MDIEAPGLLSNLLQTLLVQMGSNRLATVIPKKLLMIRINWNRGAFLGSNSNGENANTRRGCFLSGRHGIFLQIFAISQKDHCPVRSFGFPESQLCGMNRRSDISSTPLDGFSVKLGDGIEDGLIVHGQWGFNLGSSGESDQTKPITLHSVQDILGDELCSRQAVRNIVCREHAP